MNTKLAIMDAILAGVEAKVIPRIVNKRDVMG